MATDKDKVNLRLLLVDGKTHDFSFPATTTSAEVADHVFQNWPNDWIGDVQKPGRPEVLRLIYRGRFLRPTTTLSGISLPVGKTSTLHMIIRETLPDEHKMGIADGRSKSVSHSRTGCCTML